MQTVLSDGLGRVFFAGLVVAVVALVLSVLLPEVPLRTTILDQAESDEMASTSIPHRPGIEAPPAAAATTGAGGDAEAPEHP